MGFAMGMEGHAISPEGMQALGAAAAEKAPLSWVVTRAREAAMPAMPAMPSRSITPGAMLDSLACPLN